MVNVEDAVKIATMNLLKVMPDYVNLAPSIEEFQLSMDGSVWNVTFRAMNPDAENGKNVFYPYRDKVVQIRVSDGDLIAIKNPSYD